MRIDPKANTYLEWRNTTCLPLVKFQVLLLLSFGFSMTVIIQGLLIVNEDDLINVTDGSFNGTVLKAFSETYLPYMDASIAICATPIFTLALELPAYNLQHKIPQNKLENLRALLAASLLFVLLALGGMEVLLYYLPKIISYINPDNTFIDLMKKVSEKQMLYAIPFVIKTFLEQLYFSFNYLWMTAVSSSVCVLLATIASITMPFKDVSSQLVMPYIIAESGLALIYLVGLLLKFNFLLNDTNKIPGSLLLTQLIKLSKQVWPLLLTNTLSVLSPLVHAFIALSIDIKVAANIQQFYLYYYVNYLVLMAGSLLTEITVGQFKLTDLNLQSMLVSTIALNSTMMSMLSIVGLFIYQAYQDKDISAYFLLGLVFGLSELFNNIFQAANRAQDQKQNKKISLITTSGLALSLSAMVAVKYMIKDQDCETTSFALLAAPMMLSFMSMITFGVMFGDLFKNSHKTTAQISTSVVALQADSRQEALLPTQVLLPELPTSKFWVF